MIAALSGLVALAGCGSSAATNTAGSSTTIAAASAGATAVGAQAADVLATAATMASDAYAASLHDAETLQQAVDAFVADPTQANLDAARTAWLDGRPAYLHTEALRFADGPIDAGDQNLEGFINAWPLDEQYIDSIIAGSDEITAANLRAENERGGEKNISTGWHAIEYLLWGVDDNAEGPGDRSPDDFVGDSATATRSREYLSAVTDLLISDLAAVTAQWEPKTGEYARQFVALAPEEGMRRVLTGVGTLAGGELFGQRMSVPYETKDQEDEHSCFSDNTTADFVGDVESIRRVYLGLDSTGNIIGHSLSDLVASIDPTVDQRVRDAIEAAAAATAAIPKPFDQAILGTDAAPGRVAMKAAIDAVAAITDSLVDAAELLGAQIGTDVP